MKERVCIIELPSNLGLKEPRVGHEPGVKGLPDWLRRFGFHAQIGADQTFRVEPPPYLGAVDEVTGVRNADSIIQYALAQSRELERVLDLGCFPLVIGGDCSILIGNMLTLKRRGNYALFFLDGHTDFTWPEYSQTAGAAGMDLAIVSGYGHPRLTNIENAKPYVQEEQVWCVGNREYDPQYEAAIRNSRIHYYNLMRLRATGIRACVAEFLRMIERPGIDGFWVHLDVDVLQDEIMPSVDSRQPGGLNYDELREILELLLSHSKVVGLEITILDPELDPTGAYTSEFVRSFILCWENVRIQYRKLKTKG